MRHESLVVSMHPAHQHRCAHALDHSMTAKTFSLRNFCNIIDLIPLISAALQDLNLITEQSIPNK